MKEGQANKQVLKGSEIGHKSYGFNEEHDDTKPATYWFQESNEGQILFVVFYTLACRWSRCLGCNLPSEMSQYHIDYKSLMAQVDYVINLPEVKQKYKTINKVIISNNGSVLDEDTFSSTALIYLLAKLNLHLPNLKVVCVETRPEYVEIEELQFLQRVLKEGDTPTDLELAIGFEAFDDKIRNEVFFKGLRLEVVEELVAMIAPFSFHLKTYFMFKPVPFMTIEEAIEDIRTAIDYLDKLSQKYDVEINMHINPTFVSKGTVLEEHFKKGEFVPPTLKELAQAVKHAEDKRVSIFLGLYDEGLAIEGGSFIREGENQLVEILEEFNKVGDYKLLDSVINS